MPRLTSRICLALALGALGLWSGSSALAATQQVTLKSTKGDQATITLNKQTKKALKKNHIALKTNKPAKRKGNNATFPEKGGKWNFSNTSGTVNYNGVTRFVRRKHSVKLTKLGFKRTVKGKKSTATLSAFFGKKKVTLLTLTGKVKVKMKGNKETVSGLTAKLSKKAASLLNKGLKHKAFKASQKLGSFSLTLTTGAKLVTAPPPPGGNSGSAPGSATPGVALSFTPALEAALQDSGLSATPLGPAAGGILGGLSGVSLPILDGSSGTLPGTGGLPAASAGFDNGVLTASVPLDGGIQLSNGTISATLSGPVLQIGTGTDGSSGLYLSINGGPEVKAFDIDTNKLLAAALPNGTLDINGLVMELSNELAATINNLAGKQVVAPGQAAGLLNVIVPSSAVGSGS
jgi:hypothetical protein